MSGDRFSGTCFASGGDMRTIKLASEVQIGDVFFGSGQRVVEIETDHEGTITFIGDGPLGVKRSRPTPPDADCWIVEDD
jgi:hypothetical protein